MQISETTDIRPAILVVDDEPTNLQVLRVVLQDQYRLFFAKNGARALLLAAQEQPDLILLDIMMPEMSGYDVCIALKRNPVTASIPVIFVTALADAKDEAKGFAAGCVDYLTKPINAAITKARVRTHLSLVQIDTLRQTRLELIQRLGMAAEYKDNETGLHVIRMSHYARLTALALGLSAAYAEELFNAAPMHDIGKIGTPDAILQKPGPLTPEEWAVMRQHAEVGASIMGTHTPGLLQTAHTVALTHHERWDGSGYPRGLKAEEIPIEGRIVAVADVFDALTSERPYKPAWTVEAAIALLQRESGKHFDPQVVAAFLSQLPAIIEIKNRWMETAESMHQIVPEGAVSGSMDALQVGASP
ncbi:HD domain-containing phosphohydrolase [Variovorax sp. HJSM1_2]|uniref:HD domain-containing phosphohydrolase n=1 Tax=Variovorax sp. HJSM1_2 TaxID=3366263 RepID=UPI003BCF71F9